MFLVSRSVKTALLVFTIFFATISALGQGIVTGSIAGTVQDQQTAVIKGARVQAIQTGTNTAHTATTDDHGYFELKDLPLGTYAVTIEAPGFSKLQVSDVIVAADRTTSLGSRALAIGTASDLVSVEAGVPLIETTTAQIGGSFDTKVIQNLPLGNGDAGFDNLALYIPGVANNGAANFSNTNGAAIANNGLRGRSNNFQIDGQYNNDNSVAGPLVFLSNPDVVSEVQVVTNNFGAEFGRNSGSVVNYLTKSGSNSFHGTAFDYNQGDWSFSKENSQKNPLLGFCTPGQAAGTVTPYTSSKGCTTPVVPRYVENRFGGTLGGPVIKNHVWFFGSYQDDRQRSSTIATSSSLTPTPTGISMLASAFPNNAAVSSLQNFGPYAIKTGNPTPAGAVTNVNIINPANGQTQLANVPFQFVSRTLGTPFDDKQATGRGDWQITSKDLFFFRYIYQNSVNAFGTGTGSSGAFFAVPASDRDYGFDYTHTYNNHFVQQARISHVSGAIQFQGGAAFPNCVVTNFGVCPPSVGFADSVNSLTSYGPANNLPQDRQVHNTQYASNLTYTVGKHTIKFGGELDHQNSPGHFLPNTNGTFTFNSFAIPAGAPGAGTTVNAYSTFINGAGSCPAGTTCSQLSLTDGPTVVPFKENDVSFYGQDDWRILDNLTLNLGLRWEWDQEAVNLLHDLSVQNVASGFWQAGLPTSVTEIPKIPEDFNNFGPNIGFAYTPRFLPSWLGQDKTVIRGGYRIAYDPAFYNIFSNIASSAPVVNAGTLLNVALPGNTGAAVQQAYLGQLPRGANPGARNITTVSSDFHNPYVEQWSLGIERQVNSKISFEARYVGNHSVGEFQTVNLNPQICSAFNAAGTTCTAGLLVQDPGAVPAGLTPCTPAAATAAGTGSGAVGRVNCAFTNVRERDNGAWSLYHGLQNELKIQNFHGLTGDVSYTWSKALDNTSEIFASTGGISTPASQNPFDVNQGERGVSAQSFPQVFTTYWIYALPFAREQKGIMGHLIGGWEWSGTYRYQSGAPITPVQNTNNGDPYCDNSWNTNFIGSTLDACRPILGNSSAPFDTSGRYVSATQLINVSTCQSTGTNNSLVGSATCPTISPSSVRFIVNNTNAINALCGGNPFACNVGRNVSRAQARNQADMSVAKNFKVNERIGLSFRADAFNIFNYQYFGVPGLNVNNKNINGLSTTGTPSPGSFGEVFGNTGNNRQLLLSAHVSF